MTLPKNLIVLSLLLMISSCEDKQKVLDTNFSLVTSVQKNNIIQGGELTLSLKAKKDMTIDSVVYTIENEHLGKSLNTDGFKAKINTKTLGHKMIKANIHTSYGTTSVTTEISVLNPNPPKVYGYKIINTYAHQTDAYTQGLEFVGDTLYESNGKYQKSNVRKLDYETGKVLDEHVLDNSYFGEGLTVMDDRIIQLTWRENLGFVYDRKSLEKKDSFSYNQSKEGWGLCNDGKVIYKSDGTSKIWRLDPINYKEISFIEPTDHQGVKTKFNELEFINGKIFANTYQKPSIAIINPQTGAIEGVINLKSLPQKVQDGLDPDNEVLNGIAYKANEDRLFVTGKHWDTLFEIELTER